VPRQKFLRAANLLWIAYFGFCAHAHSSELRETPVPRADLCVTEGEIGTAAGERLTVNVPKMRAYLNVRTAPLIEVRFKYLGSTGNEKPLASGELRRQFGLKLRAEDACNLVYAMWRIEPESKLVVSVKTNPGEHSSSQCGNRGYRNVKPRRAQPIPALRPGATHTLRAEMKGAEMRVLIHDELAWEGDVGRDALDFDGPVGIRSDNAKLELELRSGQPSSSQPISEGCRSGDSD
jgi:hypothetical protein